MHPDLLHPEHSFRDIMETMLDPLVIMPQWSPYVVSCNRDELGRWCSATLLQVKDQRQMDF
jgi:hypothetical protein